MYSKRGIYVYAGIPLNRKTLIRYMKDKNNNKNIIINNKRGTKIQTIHICKMVEEYKTDHDHELKMFYNCVSYISLKKEKKFYMIMIWHFDSNAIT